MRGDPALENKVLLTDSTKNVDLPPSFYQVNREVRELCLLTIAYLLMLQCEFTSIMSFAFEDMNPLLCIQVTNGLHAMAIRASAMRTYLAALHASSGTH